MCNKWKSPWDCTLSVDFVTWHDAKDYNFMWWFQMALGLELICFAFELNLNGSRRVFGDLFHLHLISPWPQTWHSQFFPLAKLFKTLASFLPTLKMWAIDQCGLNFKKWSHILVALKMTKPILEIGEYIKDHFAYFCVIYFLVNIPGKFPKCLWFY